MDWDRINERCPMYTFIDRSVLNPINLRIWGIWLFTVKFSVKIQPDKQWVVAIAWYALCQVHAFQHSCQEQCLLNFSPNNNCDWYVFICFIIYCHLGLFHQGRHHTTIQFKFALFIRLFLQSLIRFFCAHQF